MGEVRIELQGISKSYYSETAVTQALRKVSLTFECGEFVAITGESGSGKSTLLNVIGGMDTFDDGEMFVDGEPTFQYDEMDWEDYRRNKIGYVFQDYSLVGHYSALDNVISALLIMDDDMEKARQTALDYLRQVGLEGMEKQRASEMSSGQKQRLSIARALAKNTGIIVADEPTGNLDSETGDQIIRLMKELSKDRLVIMVTHNFSQAEPYVTRKVRLHDGVVISDTVNTAGALSEEDAGKADTSKEDSEKQAEDTEPVVRSDSDGRKVESAANRRAEYLTQCKIAAYFAKLNRSTQRGRTVLFTAFLFVIGVVSFIFIGEIASHADDTLTKEYVANAFRRKDETRLVLSKKDKSAITGEDVKKLSRIHNVVTVDRYDLVNDINYYIEKGRDYKFSYGNVANRSHNSQYVEGSEIVSVSLINEEHFMMSSGCIDEGDLAEGRLPEARDEIVLYSAKKDVLDTQMMCYFTAINYWGADEMYQCQMKVVGILKKETEQVYFSEALCSMFGAYAGAENIKLYYGYNLAMNDYYKLETCLMIDDDLTDSEIGVSGKFPPERTPGGNGFLHYQAYDSDGMAVGDALESDVRILNHQHEATTKFMTVSQNTFDRFYDSNSYQVSVYMTSYAKTDKLIRKFERMGYMAVSTYRTGTNGYVEELVNERLLLIGISVFGLIAMLFAEVLILRSLMKIRIKDYFVLKFIGMRMQMLRKISYFEIGGYGVAALVLTIVVVWILRIAGISVIQDVMWYYEIWEYILFILYNLLLWVLTVISFNRIMKGRLNA